MNNDLRLTPVDALLVVNYINSHRSAGVSAGEGEPGRGVAPGARGRLGGAAGAGVAGGGAAGADGGAFFRRAKAFPQLGQAILPSGGRASSGIG